VSEDETEAEICPADCLLDEIIWLYVQGLENKWEKGKREELIEARGRQPASKAPFTRQSLYSAATLPHMQYGNTTIFTRSDHVRGSRTAVPEISRLYFHSSWKSVVANFRSSQ
jgi:hypothetical protein